jgi:hypothetical protein
MAMIAGALLCNRGSVRSSCDLRSFSFYFFRQMAEDIINQSFQIDWFQGQLFVRQLSVEQQVLDQVVHVAGAGGNAAAITLAGGIQFAGIIFDQKAGESLH